MSGAARPRRRPFPLFLRIFAVMLAGVVGAQAIDFGLLLLTPPPTPRLYPIAEVAQVLHGDIGGGETYRVAVQQATPPDTDDRHADRFRRRLADRLGVPIDAVHVDFERPPLFVGAQMRHRFDRPPGEPGEILFGRFSTALRLGDGSWRVVKPERHGLEPWHWQMMLWLLATLAAVAPFAWLVSRRVASPIGLFAEAAEKIGRDPRGAPLPLGGPPEIAVAASAFNEMQARIHRYVEDRVTMAAAMAHDLRTPLMRLALRVEKAPSPVRAEMAADIAEMKEMIAAALAFVRDTGRPPVRRRLSLRPLVESVAEGLADLGADVEVEPGDDIVIEADLGGLKTLLANLIGNAVQYAGAARVRLARPEGYAVIEVADDGPGLPDDMLERAFEPFFRIEPSRNRETGGSGLGLASARAVARAHGGDVILINRAEGGLLARAMLPL